MAGGTGGHVFPALAIAEWFKEQGASVLWLGTHVGMETKLVGDQYPMHYLPVRGIRGKRLLSKLVAPWFIFRAVLTAYQLIQKEQPDLVIGMGGYASGPGGIAAWLSRKPLAIHEQNALPGLTNRLLSRFAQRVFEAFPNTFSPAVGALTVGNPVRKAMIAKKVIETPCFQERPLRLLVLGGSQGALAINQLIVKVAPQFDQNQLQVWHQAGPSQAQQVAESYSDSGYAPYQLSSFIHDMAEAYQWADLVICRAGALTVSELAVMGLPSILVPFPYAVDDHQTANAHWLVRVNGAVLAPQKTLTADWLIKQLNKFMADPSQLALMREAAVKVGISDAAVRLGKVCQSWLNDRKDATSSIKEEY